MSVGEGWDPPPSEAGWSDWTWFKVRGGRILVVVILSEAPVWYRAHFYQQRMRPCVGEGCEMCHGRIGDQLRYAFAVAEVSGRRVGLLEVGRSVALQVRDFLPRNEGFRGMVLEFGKYTTAKQSRMEVTYVERPEGPWWRELEVPDVAAALRSTWEKAGFVMPDMQPSGVKAVCADAGGGNGKGVRERFRAPDIVKS
jgi:hypothetical protein